MKIVPLIFLLLMIFSAILIILYPYKNPALIVIPFLFLFGFLKSW